MNTRRESGFAMPVAIFALVVLGVLVTGGFYMARQEARIGNASENGALAFYVAERGINQVLRDYRAEDFRAIPLQGVDTVRGTVDNGEWMVEIFRPSQKMVLLDALGTVTRGGAVLSGASRRVGTMARLFYAEIDPPGALTTRGETQVSGTADIYGADSLPDGWESDLCDSIPQEDKPGLVTNDSTQVTGQGASSISGDPQGIVEDTSLDDSTFTVYGNLTYDDLVAMAQWHRPADADMSVTGAMPTTDANGACETSNPDNWGDPENPSNPCGSWFPITHFAGDATINGDVGQGILLVDGNLKMQGNVVFYGIIIVQGRIELRGTGQGIKIYGGVLASNADLEDQSVTGGSSIHTSQCATERAVLENAAVARARTLTMRSWIDLSSVTSQ